MFTSPLSLPNVLSQGFDPANLTAPQHEDLISEDIFITRRLDARHLRGSAATDELTRRQKGKEDNLRVQCFKTPPSPSGPALLCVDIFFIIIILLFKHLTILQLLTKITTNPHVLVCK